MLVRGVPYDSPTTHRVPYDARATQGVLRGPDSNFESDIWDEVFYLVIHRRGECEFRISLVCLWLAVA